MKRVLRLSLVSGFFAFGFAGCASTETAVATTAHPQMAKHQTPSRASGAQSKLDPDGNFGFFVPEAERPPSASKLSYEPVPPVGGSITNAAADDARRVWDPVHRHYAELRGKSGTQALFVDGHRVWPRVGATKFVGQPVWSPDAHGLAVVEEVQRVARLVVMVEYRDPAGDLTWPIPRDAVAPNLKVFWATDSKVVIGETLMQPRFAANWQRLN